MITSMLSIQQAAYVYYQPLVCMIATHGCVLTMITVIVHKKQEARRAVFDSKEHIRLYMLKSISCNYCRYNYYSELDDLSL